MIIDCYDIETKPIISLKDFYGEQKHIVDVCLIIFSKKIHSHLLSTYDCEEIAHFTNIFLICAPNQKFTGEEVNNRHGKHIANDTESKAFP